MVALGGKIYAAGGFGGTVRSSVEVFDQQTNSWAAVAPMSTVRSVFSLTAARGKLYAAGGTGLGGSAPAGFATVEAYDPQQDRWEAVAPMAQPRALHAATCM